MEGEDGSVEVEAEEEGEGENKDCLQLLEPPEKESKKLQSFDFEDLAHWIPLESLASPWYTASISEAR